jgi:hypothetical protein
MDKYTTEINNFWGKVNKCSSDDCWEWMGAKCYGYGYCGFQGKTQRAHRVAWIITFGDMPKGMCVCHRCDNRACVNPNHLFLGIQATNMHDMVDKGRSSRGEDRWSSKLKESDIPEIFNLWGVGMPYGQIGERYGVSKWVIRNVVKRITWTHVKI